MLRVGLTGGIACGKSHVLRRLAAAGCHVLDLDRASREVMAPGGTAFADVVAAFGSAVLAPDGSIDRAALGRVVFADEAARERLNGLVHPHIRAVEEVFAARHSTEPGAVAVVDGALLVEVGMHLRFDRLVVAHCTPEEQRARLMARDGLDETAARARLAAQMPQDQKRSFAHFAVSTSGSTDETRRRADEVAARLRALAVQPRSSALLSPARSRACLELGPARGPRGLSPRSFLAFLEAEPGLDLQALVRHLGESRPWHRPGPAPEGEAGPEVLVSALTVWAWRAHGADLDHLLGAARSLAAAFSPGHRALARACLAGRLAFECALKAPPEPRWISSDEALAPVRHWARTDGELEWAEGLLREACRGSLSGALAGLGGGTA